MISPQGTDELFWGKDHEDVNDWVEHLIMATEVIDLNDDKLFKIAKLNLHGRAKEWFKKLNPPPPTDWTILKIIIVQKFGDVDVNEIHVKLDAIKQEPEEWVKNYFERLDKLFQRGKIRDVEQRKRFLAQLRPKLRRFYVLKIYTNIE
jgi:hypothetical protein